MKNIIFTATLLFIGTIVQSQSIPITGDQYHYYGPNSTWGAVLKVGGNGRETSNASVVATNGNLHLDSKDGNFRTYINHYSQGHTILNTSGGDVGIGIASPGEKLHVNGNIRIGENFKYLIKRHNVTSEMFIASHGQGAGWMINAEFSGSGNPQNNASFTVNAGNYNTGAGYLDFDGNARMWSLFASEGVSSIGSSVSFKSLADFRLNQYVRFSTSGDTDDLYINSNGYVGLGTTTTGSHRLAVEGTIGAREIKVEMTDWQDRVFYDDYDLRTLEEVEEHIAEKGHLPEIPSEAEVTENGINLGEMDAKLLMKIEELTLYMIDMNKQMKTQATEIEQLKMENSKLKNEVSALKNE